MTDDKTLSDDMNFIDKYTPLFRWAFRNLETEADEVWPQAEPLPMSLISHLVARGDLQAVSPWMSTLVKLIAPTAPDVPAVMTFIRSYILDSAAPKGTSGCQKVVAAVRKYCEQAGLEPRVLSDEEIETVSERVVARLMRLGAEEDERFMEEEEQMARSFIQGYVETHDNVSETDLASLEPPLGVSTETHLSAVRWWSAQKESCSQSLARACRVLD